MGAVSLVSAGPCGSMQSTATVRARELRSTKPWWSITGFRKCHGPKSKYELRSNDLAVDATVVQSTGWLSVCLLSGDMAEDQQLAHSYRIQSINNYIKTGSPLVTVKQL
jgi:hypothetical protein